MMTIFAAQVDPGRLVPWNIAGKWLVLAKGALAVHLTMTTTARITRNAAKEVQVMKLTFAVLMARMCLGCGSLTSVISEKENPAARRRLC
mmetsp:Transcript_28634/g.41638  ORF Transcript_28634/g.41638 Transcript_28634/m.41638 type:complete len:90 (-) Transcript_28634:380-649(-)